MHVVNTKRSTPRPMPGPAHRCASAAALADPLFRRRIVQSKKNYARHGRHKGRQYE